LIALRAFALLLFFFIPGWLAASLLRGGKEVLDDRERLFLAASLGVGIVAASAMALSLASAYSLPGLLALVGAVCVMLALAARKRVAWLWRVGLKDLLFTLAVIAVALILFVPPGRTVFGWSDVGVYPDIAAHIQREGGEVMEVPTVQEVAPERRDLVYEPNEDPNLPFEANENKAFLITDFESGRVVPLFYFLWPSFMAVFASFLGLDSMFWAVTAMGVLGLWGLFLLARRLLGWRWGLAATVLGALSPLFIYFARYTTSEMMNMALFIPAALCLTIYLRVEGGKEEKAAKRLAVASAFFFGLCFMCRIDFLLILIPLILGFLGKRVFSGLSKTDWLFLGLTLAGAALAVLMGAIFSAPYFHTIWGSFTNIWQWIFNPFAAALALIVLVFIFAGRLRNAAIRLKRARNLWVALLWLALGAWFVYLYFIRPQGPDSLIEYGVINPIQGSSYISQTLLRWAWYFSFPGLLLIFGGYALWFSRRRNFPEIPVAMVGFVFTLIFSWSMRCTPLHILTMRRLIPVIVPVATLMVTYALKCLVEGADKVMKKWTWGNWVGRIAAAGIMLYLVLFFANASIPIFGLEEGGNQLELCGNISESVEAGAVVLMDYHLGDLFGPPLRCFYGVENAWILNNGDLESEEYLKLLGDLDFPSRPVYLLWRPAMSGANIALADGLSVERIGEYLSWEEMLEKSFDHRPGRPEYYQDEIWLLRLEEAREDPG